MAFVLSLWSLFSSPSIPAIYPVPDADPESSWEAGGPGSGTRVSLAELACGRCLAWAIRPGMPMSEVERILGPQLGFCSAVTTYGYLTGCLTVYADLNLAGSGEIALGAVFRLPSLAEIERRRVRALLRPGLALGKVTDFPTPSWVSLEMAFPGGVPADWAETDPGFPPQASALVPGALRPGTYPPFVRPTNPVAPDS